MPLASQTNGQCVIPSECLPCAIGSFKRGVSDFGLPFYFGRVKSETTNCPRLLLKHSLTVQHYATLAFPKPRELLGSLDVASNKRTIRHLLFVVCLLCLQCFGTQYPSGPTLEKGNICTMDHSQHSVCGPWSWLPQPYGPRIPRGR